jgi:hypothetical protein
VKSQPSPTQDAWLFVADVRPSTLSEEYDRPRLGEAPLGALGAESE